MAGQTSVDSTHVPKMYQEGANVARIARLTGLSEPTVRAVLDAADLLGEARPPSKRTSAGFRAGMNGERKKPELYGIRQKRAADTIPRPPTRRSYMWPVGIE